MDFSPIVTYVESVLRAEKGVPGCDLKIMRQHETLFRYQSGVADYDGAVPVAGDEVYFLYSCSKPITCAVGMHLVERGALGLDEPVSKYLPEFADAFLLKEGKKVRPDRTMTVRHLFTMSAGFDYDRDAAPIRAVIDADPKAGTLDIVNAFVRSPLHFEPGEKFQYSLCHDVLAGVIEVAAGLRFSDFLRKNIFAPLGMTRTGFVVPAEEKPHLMAQYTCQTPGEVTRIPQTMGYQLTENYESGGAGLYSCVEDYSLFADAMANGGVGASGAQILRPATIDLMRTEQLSAYAVSDKFSCAAGPGYGYGLGVRTLISKAGGQRSSLGEFGWDGAAGSYVMIDPAYGLSIFFAMHVTSWPQLIGCGHAPIRDLTYEVLGL